MKASRKNRRLPAVPHGADPLGVLPSEQEIRSVTVKLDALDRQALGRCRRLLAGPEGESYPTASRTIRLAIGALYHSLTGAPPAEKGGPQ